jgi:prepilin-type N-terminal cleavage/methylation domain-containing protein
MHTPTPKRRGFTLIEIMITISIISLLLAIAVPNWIKSREATQSRGCQKQLHTIRGAKEQYVMTRNLGTSATITMNDLVTDGWLRPGMVCPEGFDYTIGAVNEDPTCQSGLTDHAIQ